MVTSKEDAQRFVARKYIRDRLHDATGARVDPRVVDAIVEDLHERLAEHVAKVKEAHEKERELRIYHAVHEYCPMLRPHHLGSK